MRGPTSRGSIAGPSLRQWEDGSGLPGWEVALERNPVGAGRGAAFGAPAVFGLGLGTGRLRDDARAGDGRRQLLGPLPCRWLPVGFQYVPSIRLPDVSGGCAKGVDVRAERDVSRKHVSFRL